VGGEDKKEDKEMVAIGRSRVLRLGDCLSGNRPPLVWHGKGGFFRTLLILWGLTFLSLVVALPAVRRRLLENGGRDMDGNKVEKLYCAEAMIPHGADDELA
jgi:hypothetical protein